MAKLQFATLSNLQEFLNLHNVQIDSKISEAVKNSIKTVSQSEDGYTLYFYTKTAPVTIDEAAFTITIPQPTGKADKVKGEVKGHLAGLDENGNLVDSGKTVADFDAAGAANTAKTEVMSYVGTIPADAKAKNVVAYIKEAVTTGQYDDSALKASEGAGGGGGSSDIRIGTDSLYARVIVAGGGGGGGEDNETGGYGGGETGGTSGSGTPGSQTAPSGYFGIGGHTSYDGGGGGGGWYGAYPAGGQTTPATGSSGSDTSGSPGGSGYVYTSATASNYPSGCLLNSSYYLSAAKTIAGNTSFTSPTGSSETGHSGNGYCRITVIECKNTALYTRINNSMKLLILNLILLLMFPQREVLQ